MVPRITTVTRIARTLGKGTSYRYIITSTILALISLFYIYTLGSYFQVDIYSLDNRTTFFTFFDFYIINKYLDHIIIVLGLALWLAFSVTGKAKFVAPTICAGVIVIAILSSPDVLLPIIALMSIPIVISFLIYNKFASKKRIINTPVNLYVNYLAIIGIGIGIIGVIISLAPLFSISLQNSIPMRNYAYEVFLLFSSSSSILILLLISCFPVKLLIKEFMTRILKIKNNIIDSFSNNNDKIKSRIKIMYLLSFMILSVVLALIPHQPAINNDNQQIGVDTGYYIRWINPLIHSNDVQEFIRQAFVIQNHGDRPLTLIFLFTIVKILHADLFYTFEHIPVILGPALVLVIYFLTRELTSNNNIASLLASFLTAVSFHTLIGIYAGFYANWFALIIGYLSFVFLFRFLKRPQKLNLAVYSISMVALLFAHIYTWTILTIIMGIFLLVMLKFNYYQKKNLILLLLVILFSIVLDITRMTITGSTGGIERDMELAGELSGLGQFALRWNNLERTIQTFVGGLFSNFIIFTLGLYWLYRSNWREPSTIFLMVFLSIGLFPFLFGNWLIQSRVFYDIPFQIPAAIALCFIMKKSNGTVIVLSICLWLAAMSIRSVLNFYYIPL